MPEPAQQKHAEKIRAERAVMNLTGLSRSQIRDGLREFATKRQDADRILIPQRIDNFRPESPKIEISETHLEKRPFQEQGQAVVGGDVPLGAAVEATIITAKLCVQQVGGAFATETHEVHVNP